MLLPSYLTILDLTALHLGSQNLQIFYLQAAIAKRSV